MIYFLLNEFRKRLTYRAIAGLCMIVLIGAYGAFVNEKMPFAQRLLHSFRQAQGPASAPKADWALLGLPMTQDQQGSGRLVTLRSVQASEISLALQGLSVRPPLRSQASDLSPTLDGIPRTHRFASDAALDWHMDDAMLHLTPAERQRLNGLGTENKVNDPLVASPAQGAGPVHPRKASTLRLHMASSGILARLRHLHTTKAYDFLSVLRGGTPFRHGFPQRYRAG